MTELQLKQWLANMSKSCRELNRRLSIEIPYPHEDKAYHLPPRPEPKSAVLHEPLGPIPGKKKDPGRILIRITSFRRHLLDTDDICPKYFVDCLRYAGLLHSDSFAAAEVATRQKKVRLPEEERTEIEIV